MRRPLFLLLPVTALVAACAFPVDDFVVEGRSADAGADASSKPSASTAPDASSAAPDTSRPCTCTEYDKDKCKKWEPEKCGEGK